MIGEVEKQVSAVLPWLEDLPLNWKIEKAKHIFVERTEKGFPNEPLLAATQSQGVIRKEHYETRTVTAQKDFHLLKLVKKNDFVISLRSFQGGIEIAHDQGIISPAYSIFFPKRGSKVDINFYKHFFKSEPFIRSLSLFVTGIREGQNIDFNLFRNSPLPYPPVKEQNAIANFLDKKCEQINDFIANKQKLIELLKEQKQAIINKAVTKGINPNVKMRASDIEWLGEIPEHWKTIPLKYILKEKSERSEDGVGRLLMVSQEYGVVERSAYHEKAEVAQSTIGHKVCSNGDLVFNKLKAHLGVFFKSAYDGLVSPDYAVYYSNKIDVAYLEHLFRHPGYIHEFSTRTTGIVEGLMRLYTSELFSIKVPIPPANELTAILEYIRFETESINSAQENILKELDLIKEYKQSLIAEAATGKIKIL